MPLIPPMPSGAQALPWLMANLDGIPDYLNVTRALGGLQAAVTINGVTTRTPARYSAQNSIIDLGSLSLLDPETVIWLARIVAAGGSANAASVALANALITSIKATTFNAKIVYLLPLLGQDLIAARVPLRDSLGVGIASNTGFVNADFNQAHGLQGDGLTKMLGTSITSAQTPGMGYWENNYAATAGNPPAPTSTVPIGNASSGGIRLFWIRNWSDNQIFHYGTTGGDADPAGAKLVGAGGNHHYYGQPEGNSFRRLVKDGITVATSSVATAATGAGDHEINILGVNYAGADYFYPGRCAVSYLTDATLTVPEFAALHALLTTKLITPLSP